MSANTFCSHYNRHECRSCRLIEQPYSEQIVLKESRLKAALAFLNPFQLEPTFQSKMLGFRNRAKMVVTGSTDLPVIGLLGESKLDEGRSLLSCPIHHPELNRLLKALPKWITEFNLIPYQIGTQKGELKALILFYSESTDQLYLRFVLRSQECVARIKKLLPSLQAEFPNVVCVSANIQPIPHAILEGPHEIILSQKEFIDYGIGPLTLKLSPQAFVQTNTTVASGLYETAAKWIEELRTEATRTEVNRIETVCELFCGQGAFSFFAAHSAKKIVGIEVNPFAVKTANETAEKLGLTHLHFICAEVPAKPLSPEKRTEKLAEKLADTLIHNPVERLLLELNPDLVLVNPPRRGIGEAGVELILKTLPKFMVYSSCEIESLASDLVLLAGHYRALRAQVFDLFPHTEHFETLVLLERKTEIN